MAESVSISFFDEQFRKQSSNALALNPFELLTLPYLKGDVLDFGCGLGNLAFAAASNGCNVTALDASPAAVDHIRKRALATGLPVAASQADLREYPLTGSYDAVVSIGLLMFFDCSRAMQVLHTLQTHVRPGGIAAINVLVDGTTYFDMFDPVDRCLFAPMALRNAFDGWDIQHMQFSEFPAPNDSLKRFCTLIAQKPAQD